MKEYPSIPNSNNSKFQEIPNAYIFDKLDGSSMRSEWSKKKGWYKHGKRHGLIDHSNPHLLQVPTLFDNILNEPLSKLAIDNKWDSLTVFYEFWGNQSIGGLHQENDPKFLTIFDAAINKKGILSPSEFIKYFQNNNIPTASFLGIHNFTRGFIQKVRLNQLPGITFEGVVAKAGSNHNIIRGKAKTQQWIDKIRILHGPKADSIINS